MPSDSNSSAPSSAPTSNAAPKSQPPTEVSEADFLARQANDAKAAISRVTQEITGDIARTVDPRGWVQAAPWTTLAAAVLVGFAGTALVVPSKEEQALRRLRKLEKALRAEERSHRRNGNGDRHRDEDDDDDSDRDDSPRHSFLVTLAGHAFGVLKPMITTAVTAALSSRAAAPPPPPTDPQTDPS